MAFDDLDQAAGEQSRETEPELETETSMEEPTTTETEQPTSDEQTEVADSVDPYEEPAFPFVQGDMQTNVYVREETRETRDETQQFEVDRILHEHGVKNVAGREHHDAIFRMAADHPELWARYVMEARGLAIPDDLADG